MRISIHATHAGGDGREIFFDPIEFLFQSTPPTRVATGGNGVIKELYEFQSTPPTRVATSKFPAPRDIGEFQSTPPTRVATPPFALDIPIEPISIHATHAGGDQCLLRAFPHIFLFQSTPPTRVATNVSSVLFPIFSYFNPRHPRGWRQATWHCPISYNYFNPRHPRGWRQHYFYDNVPYFSISIHATHAGGDEIVGYLEKGDISISIHATHAGGDSKNHILYLKYGFLFQQCY